MMNIREQSSDNTYQEVVFEYTETDSFDSLDYTLCRQVYGLSFVDDELVICSNGRRGGRSFTGGTIEPDENFEQTLRREILEESNMEVLSFLPLGYQKVISKKDNSFIYQLRYVCKVKPFGPFVSDPGGNITGVKLIDPKEHRHYIDWGTIGEELMSKALKLLPTMSL